MTQPNPLRRSAWLAAGSACLLLGTIGIVLPLLPTLDMYGLAAFCFARGDRRWEAWLVSHPRFGPAIQAWRTQRAVPMPAKCVATLSMTVSCGLALAWLPGVSGWLPIAACLPVLAYLWSRPSAAVAR
jgi:uncharacterized protein